MKPRPLVIGIGNRLRGDDAAGPALADLLAVRRPDAEILVVQELLPELAERLAGVNFVLFLDASIVLPPGSVDIGLLAPAAATSLGHAMTPATLLALAGQLYARAPTARQLRVGAVSFTLGAPLSEPVAAALARAVTLAEGALPPGEHPSEANTGRSKEGFFF